MKIPDYYTTLGVDRDSSQDQIKTARRKLARQYHFALAEEAEAEERFKEISETYDELGLHRPGEGFNPSPECETRFWREGGHQEVDLGDLFEQMGFRTAARSRREPVDFAIRGQDVEVVTELSLKQAAHGSQVAFTLTVPSFRPDGSVERQPHHEGEGHRQHPKSRRPQHHPPEPICRHGPAWHGQGPPGEKGPAAHTSVRC